MRIAFFRSSRRIVLPILLSVALAACSGDVSPPLGIDDDTTVSAIPPEGPQEDTITYAAPVDAVRTTDRSTDYLDTPNLAGSDLGTSPEPDALPRMDEEPVNQTAIPSDGINMDQALGVEQPLGLAEGETTQPVVDGIGTDTLTERQPRRAATTETVDFRDATSVEQITPPSRRREVERETQVAFLPRPADPTAEPEDEVPLFSQMSAAERACRKDLERMGVRFQELPSISKGRSCGIAHPIKVSGLQGGIQMKPAATLNCQMTRFLAKWVKNELVPSARNRYFSGVKTIHQMSSYSCRKMNSRSRNPWSEHAKGNALDIGGFTLKNGKHIDVRKKSFFAFREKGLLKTVREDSCKYFTTVLGPGDAYHGDHFHFDLRPRKSGYRHCSL